jgi:hypothetical protein
MEPGEEVVFDEMERRLNLSWQGWHLDKDDMVLRHETLSASHGYTIDMLRCTTSAQLLGWILELAPGLGAPILGLVRAFDDIFNPRMNLCPDGDSKGRKLSQRKIRELVAAAHEPPHDGSRHG